jgi:hypothetical protein
MGLHFLSRNEVGTIQEFEPEISTLRKAGRIEYYLVSGSIQRRVFSR